MRNLMIEHLKRVEELRKRQLKEYRISCKNEKVPLQIEAFTNDVWDLIVGVLSNYETAISRNGSVKPMQDVIETIKEFIAENYSQHTGRDFVPEHVKDLPPKRKPALEPYCVDSWHTVASKIARCPTCGDRMFG